MRGKIWYSGFGILAAISLVSIGWRILPYDIREFRFLVEMSITKLRVSYAILV
jgi:hypothetical protein